MSRENEGAERAHPRDWPARCGYEVRELDRHDGEVYSRSRSASSTRTRVPGLLALSFVRRLLALTISTRRTGSMEYGKPVEGGDGGREKEHEQAKGKSKQWWAEYDVSVARARARVRGYSYLKETSLFVAFCHRLSVKFSFQPSGQIIEVTLHSTIHIVEYRR
ncbi:hypothetical protein B0H13DRAFT_151807 [Mycena leptocephala]|nr:hypothetical protein B0H13DRAFT_151807 [Mycena leptocephala]